MLNYVKIFIQIVDVQMMLFNLLFFFCFCCSSFCLIYRYECTHLCRSALKWNGICNANFVQTVQRAKRFVQCQIGKNQKEKVFCLFVTSIVLSSLPSFLFLLYASISRYTRSTATNQMCWTLKPESYKWGRGEREREGNLVEHKKKCYFISGLWND